MFSTITLLTNRTKAKLRFQECHYFGKPFSIVGNFDKSSNKHIMKSLTRIFEMTLTLISLLFLSSKVFATWSVAILDSTTKTIGVAGASCTFNVVGIAKIITGKGVLMAQAYSDDNISGKGLEMIRQGAAPNEILKALTDPTFDKEVPFRLYGIATFNYFENPVTFTGDSISVYPFAATESSPGICVQGNTLADLNVVKELYKAVSEARKKFLNMEETLMIALEVGSKYGGDRRCGSQ